MAAWFKGHACSLRPRVPAVCLLASASERTVPKLGDYSLYDATLTKSRRRDCEAVYASFPSNTSRNPGAWPSLSNRHFKPLRPHLSSPPPGMQHPPALPRGGNPAQEERGTESQGPVRHNGMCLRHQRMWIDDGTLPRPGRGTSWRYRTVFAPSPAATKFGDEQS